jgi:hypothetical protein
LKGIRLQLQNSGSATSCKSQFSCRPLFHENMVGEQPTWKLILNTYNCTFTPTQPFYMLLQNEHDLNMTIKSHFWTHLESSTLRHLFFSHTMFGTHVVLRYVEIHFQFSSRLNTKWYDTIIANCRRTISNDNYRRS